VPGSLCRTLRIAPGSRKTRLYCLLFSPPSPRGLLALCPSLSRRRKS
jgi:hypothetical protein